MAERGSTLDQMIEQARQDRAVYLTDVREHLLAAGEAALVLDLTGFDGAVRRIPLRVPADAGSGDRERFVREYLYAEVYNLLSALGGRRLDLYVDAASESLRRILRELPAAFGIGRNRRERAGYGRCVNVIERMLESQGMPGRFAVEAHVGEQPPLLPPPPAAKGGIESRYAMAFEGVERKLLCGVDVGGTDIKLAVSVRGELRYLKEYDWFPAQFTRSRQLIDPVLLLVRLLRARVSCEQAPVDAALVRALDRAIAEHLPDGEIDAAVTAAEQALGGDLRGFDGIGLCFPDVVVRNKVVGGEVFKTRGIRDNPEIEYEAEFRELMHLDERLRPCCAPGGVVRMCNDGPMAAVTSAMELIAQGEGARLRSGRFAHTLGTELGTGWIDEAGDIPEIPLEVYNFIIDLGSYGARRYPPDDLRSINNFNTGLPGTLQKYMAQNGVFRLAIKASQSADGALYRELLAQGFVQERDGGVFVAMQPKDMRKPLLDFLMERCEAGDPQLSAVFEEIGRATGITFRETEHVLAPRTRERVMYGRLVKRPRCFALLEQGARQVEPALHLSVANEQSAHSGLMRQLREHPVYTVAQFAQSVGALYYANMPR